MLPIEHIVDELLLGLQQQNTVILQAPPGAGKSTWLPLRLLEQSWLTGRIIMLEPRRLAARSVAQRLASQLHQTVGETIGYRIRAESCISQQTRLEVVTEGVLTRMLQADSTLAGVSLVILDEFHERSLHADLALALLTEVTDCLRDDLKLLIMSATLDNSALTTYLPQALAISSSGKSYPVQRFFVPGSTHHSIEVRVISAIRQLLQQESGSMLVFLPGMAEILRIQATLMEEMAEQPIDIIALYGALSLSQQQKAIQPAEKGRRKIVLATNIAETSLTIEGICLVVDSGLERSSIFEVKNGLTRLMTSRISKSSMIQRAGRAGRLQPGVCWHLLAKEQAERASEQSVPEILQAELTSLVLEVLNWGCTEVYQLNWLTPPPIPTVEAAKQLLGHLQAIDKVGRLTEQGRRMVTLGCEPRLAAMLVYAQSLNSVTALATAVLLVAILEEPPRSAQTVELGYWLTFPTPAWLKRARQLAQRLKSEMIEPDGCYLPILLFSAFADRLAVQRGRDGSYRLANGLGATLDLTEPLSSTNWLICPELVQGANAANARILLATAIEPEQIGSMFPTAVTEHIQSEWDEKTGELRTYRQRLLSGLPWQMQMITKPSAEQRVQALLTWIEEHGLDALNWSASAQQLRTRIICATKWFPELSWPAVDDVTLLRSLTQWLAPILSGVKGLKALQQLDLTATLSTVLDWQQRQQLDQWLPTHYVVPTGSRLPIHYRLDQLPILAVKLQEMYGEQQTPYIAQGRIAVILELLSPAGRPLQLTSDLQAFWQNAYQEVKKEMRGRYPKHLWPDDPQNTLPTKKTKKFQ